MGGKRMKTCVYCPVCNLSMKSYQAGNIPMIGKNYDKNLKSKISNFESNSFKMYQAFQCQKCELYAIIKFYKGKPKGDMT